MFANNVKYNKLGSKFPTLTNLVLNTGLTKKIMGIAPQRSIPKLANKTLRKWIQQNTAQLETKGLKKGNLTLFCDEFTNYYDTQVGIDTIKLLTRLGYSVSFTEHHESGRSHISKGFLDEAKVLANQNIATFKDIINEDNPLIGIEPSAILSFRDEYLRLADDKVSAKNIAKHTFTIEEFIKKESSKGNITAKQFTNKPKTIKIHGHCHQKALSSTEATFTMLNLPENYKVTIINSGCCGMAGSFGYEKEHYELSMKVGEQSLFSKIRKFDRVTEIAASGTSCRHQIYDGTKKTANHPVQILLKSLL